MLLSLNKGQIPVIPNKILFILKLTLTFVIKLDCLIALDSNTQLYY